VTSRLVLIVDDDTDFLSLARGILEKASGRFTVRTARTGAEASTELARRDAPAPTAIVLDMRLTDMTATDVLRRFPTSVRNVPVLVLTQALWKADEAAAREAGATAIHEKPGRFAVLRALLVDFATHGTVDGTGGA